MCGWRKKWHDDCVKEGGLMEMDMRELKHDGTWENNLFNFFTYNTEQIATAIGLKGARTRRLLNELVQLGFWSVQQQRKIESMFYISDMYTFKGNKINRFCCNRGGRHF